MLTKRSLAGEIAEKMSTRVTKLMNAQTGAYSDFCRVGGGDGCFFVHFSPKYLLSEGGDG